MIYLMMCSTHFYLRSYGIRHMVKDHSDSKRGNPLPPHRLLFPISRQDNTYHGLCYTSRGALVGTRNGSTMMNRSDNHRNMSKRSYHGATSRSPRVEVKFLPLKVEHFEKGLKKWKHIRPTDFKWTKSYRTNIGKLFRSN